MPSNVTTTKQTFELLVSTICQIHDELAVQASRAGNASLTLHNWMIQ